jgi:hypothetical protein
MRNRRHIPSRIASAVLITFMMVAVAACGGSTHSKTHGSAHRQSTQSIPSNAFGVQREAHTAVIYLRAANDGWPGDLLTPGPGVYESACQGDWTAGFAQEDETGDYGASGPTTAITVHCVVNFGLTQSTVYVMPDGHVVS